MTSILAAYHNLSFRSALADLLLYYVQIEFPPYLRPHKHPELVEKFDNARIRLRRRKEERERDGHRTIDPYRSMYGAGEWSAVVIIFSVLIFIVIIAGLIAEIVTM